MHLETLTIGSVERPFKNLRGITLYFPRQSETDSEEKYQEPVRDLHTHAIIGQNGTGKSNLIEAIITIFRDVDLDRDASLDYDVTYHIRDHTVRIHSVGSEQKRPFVWVDGNSESQGYLLKNRELLPSHVFAYYSGRNERLEKLFQEHQRRFNHRQEITAEESMPAALLDPNVSPEIREQGLKRQAQREANKTIEKFGDDRLRRLFYCRGGHSQLVLLACLLSDDPVFKKVLHSLHIEALESALFVLKQPHRLRDLADDDITQGDPRFWFARGNVVSEFLDKLWQVSWAPIQHEESRLIDFRGRTERQRQLYCFVPTQEKLQELGQLIGTTDSFFRYAEGAYIGDLIDEVRITVQKRDEHGGAIEFTQLSEGELQMLTVLGLMRITNQDHCLFLLDEPDTHLNPIWKLRYFDDIESVLKPTDGAIIQGESQIIITTHDPIMVGSLRREQVQILHREGSTTTVMQPDMHPQGMGVTGLLKSDLFGLSSTLDVETQRRLHRRNALFATDNRTPQQDAELSRLSAELADLGFSNADFRDPTYAAFVRAMAKHTEFQKPDLTPAERDAQERIAKEIIDEILDEDPPLPPFSSQTSKRALRG